MFLFLLSELSSIWPNIFCAVREILHLIVLFLFLLDRHWLVFGRRNKSLAYKIVYLISLTRSLFIKSQFGIKDAYINCLYNNDKGYNNQKKMTFKEGKRHNSKHSYMFFHQLRTEECYCVIHNWRNE